MFEAIFSFRGRIGRLAFFGWTVSAAILVLMIGYGFVILGGVLSAMVSADGPGPRILGIGLVLILAIIGIWAALALQIRRARDMGFKPLRWMFAVSAALIADQWLLTSLTGMRFFPPLSQYTPFGGFICMAYLIVLISWPSFREAPASSVAAAPSPRPERTSLAPVQSSLLLVTPSELPRHPQFDAPK